MVDTREERGAEVSPPRRVASGPKLRRDLAEDYAGETPRPRIGGGVRVTLPRGFPGSRLGRWGAALVFVGLLGTVAAGGWMARRHVLQDRRFFVPTSDSVQISGNRHLTRAQLLSVFGGDVDRNVLTVPLAERRAELEQLPWVEHATVMRLLPHTLRVAIVERSPVAFYREGGRVGLVDGSGVLLDLRTGDGDQPQYSFPVLSGISADAPLSTRAARMRIFGMFMSDLRNAGDGIADRLSEVDLSSPEDVKALVPVGGGDILVHFGNEQFLERYKRFEENLSKWKADYPKLASADMRYPRQVVLEMKPGTVVPVASAPVSMAAAKPLSGTRHPAAPPRKHRSAPVPVVVAHLQRAYDVTAAATRLTPHPGQAGPR